MGLAETEVKKRRKKRNIQQAVLSVVGAAGILTVALVAPNVLQSLPHVLGKEKYKLAFGARSATQKLLAKGQVRFVERDGKKYLEVTEAGRKVLTYDKARSPQARRKKRWDGLYRVVAFDVPEKRRSVRERLRREMRSFGFLQIQKSMWVYPHDCEELITLVKADLRVGKDVLYMIVESIENDTWIKDHFDLKQ